MKYIQDFENHIIPTPLEINYSAKLAIDLADFVLESDEKTAFVAEKLRKIFKFNGTCGKVLQLILNENLSDDEEYRIKISEDSGTIEFASYRAGVYALETMKQLAMGTGVYPVEIIDKPCLKMRGFNLCLLTLRHADIDSVLSLIDSMGKFKLNTLLLEYGSRFPFINSHEVLCTPDAFSLEDVQRIEKRCQEWGVEIIPLIQCLGHNGYIGVHEEYQHLFEPGAKCVGDMQLCPLKSDSFKLFTELAAQIMQAHPNSKYFHIGADEVRSLGNCPDCAEFAKKHGVNQLYVDYVNKACDWVIEQGKIPMVWDDMLGHYPEILPQLNKKAVILYWDYWTINETSPLFVARPSGNFQVTNQATFEGISDSGEKKIVQAFARKIDINELLQDPRLQQLRPYLGDNIPERFNSFPFYDFYRDMGFQVVGSPTALGDPDDDENGMPNFVRTLGNIRAFANKCKAEKSLGMVTTSWHNFPPEILLTGIMETAQNSWKK